MDIVLFQDVTTGEVLNDLLTESKEYDGLYVDMDNAPERKYVKDKAELINGIRKKLNRARIDLAKSYKVSVESEFKSLDELLAKANEPFDLLIDEHKAKRAKILADEKAAAQLIIDAEQKENDHEFALLLNQTWEYDQAKIELERAKEVAKIADEAAAKAVADHKALVELRCQEAVNAENARLANREHVAGVNRGILDVLTHHGLSEEDAKLVIRLAVHNKLPQLTINY